MDVQEDLRARKPATARIAEILDIAEKLVVETGALPISMKRVGEALGSSRALTYAYFSDPDQLAEAVIERQLTRLADAGFEQAVGQGGFEARVLAGAALYLAHIAQFGPVLHIAVRDLPPAAGPVARPHIRIIAKLARSARADLKLGAHEALVLVELLMAAPEEAGRLVFEGKLALDEAQSLCRRLLASGVGAVTPRAPARA